MSFKDYVASDIDNTFMNVEEFSSEDHTIDGTTKEIIVDDLERNERTAKGEHEDGLYTKKRIIYVKAEDYGELPEVRTYVELDNEDYIVVDAAEEDGIYSITLEAMQN